MKYADGDCKDCLHKKVCGTCARSKVVVCCGNYMKHGESIHELELLKIKIMDSLEVCHHALDHNNELSMLLCKIDSPEVWRARELTYEQVIEWIDEGIHALSD